MLMLISPDVDSKKSFIIIELEFFGILGRFFKSSLFFQILSGTTVLQLREILVRYVKRTNNFFDFELLRFSVFSNYSEVLSDVFILNFSQKLFLLPPAAGG